MTDANKALMQAFRNGDANAVADAIAEGGELTDEVFGKFATGGVDLSEVELANTEFEECILSGTSFRDANLDCTYIHGSTFVECDFRGATLTGASIEGSVFRQCDFTGAKFEESELKGAEFSDCALADLKLDEATWESVTISGGKIARVNGGATLNGVVIRDATIESFDTSEMELTSCTTNVSPPPKGFSPLSGRRTRIG